MGRLIACQPADHLRLRQKCGAAAARVAHSIQIIDTGCHTRPRWPQKIRLTFGRSPIADCCPQLLGGADLVQKPAKSASFAHLVLL